MSHKNKSQGNGSKLSSGRSLPLGRDVYNFLSGLLLGDGGIYYAPSQKSGCYQHADKHEEYIIWLFDKLGEFGFNHGPIYRRENGVCTMRTKYYRGDLIKLRNKWYPQGKKCVPNDIIITPDCLKNWYIGDGSYRKGSNGTKKGERVFLCMEFDDRGRVHLSEKLKILDIENNIYSNGIYIVARSRKRFFEYMQSGYSFIPPCYEYKFPEVYCGKK